MIANSARAAYNTGNFAVSWQDHAVAKKLLLFLFIEIALSARGNYLVPPTEEEDGGPTVDA